MAKDNGYIIAVDFDGTCVEHDYPDVGLDVEGAVDTLQELNKRGHKLILYTMRSGDKLEAACRWFKERKIELWGVNENPEQRAWSASPKVYADYYIDDSALGTPIIYIDGAPRPVVDWTRLRELLKYNRIL